jgi:hypothetical protein
MPNLIPSPSRESLWAKLRPVAVILLYGQAGLVVSSSLLILVLHGGGVAEAFVVLVTSVTVGIVVAWYAYHHWQRIHFGLSLIICILLSELAALPGQLQNQFKYQPTATPSGVYGKVSLMEGNCRSFGSGNKDHCNISDVSRKIYFYKPPLTPGDLSGGHYKGNIIPVAIAESDKNGNYQINLPAGTYSILAQDEGGQFCDTTPDGGNCNLVVTGDPQYYLVQIDHSSY